MAALRTDELCAIPKYVDWIDKSQIRVCRLLFNPNAIHIIEYYLFHLNKLLASITYTELLNHELHEFGTLHDEFPNTHQHLLKKYVRIFGFDNVSKFCNDVAFLRKHKNALNWSLLSGNRHAIELLRERPECIDWSWLSSNSGAMGLLLENYDRICWNQLSYNTAAVDLLEKNIDRVCPVGISQNDAAVHILMTNPHKIDWHVIPFNKNAWPLIERYNPDFEYKFAFAEHRHSATDAYAHAICDVFADKPWAIDVVKKSSYKYYYQLSKNPAIFEIDFITPSKRRMELIRDDLMSVALRPERVAAWRAAGIDLACV